MRFVPIIALLALASCATPFEARVNRFQSLPAPSGQSFTIKARDPAKAGGLEFATYANIIRQKLTAVGYSEAPAGVGSSLVVNVDYAVSQPREKVETFGSGYGGYGYGGFGFGGGFGGYGRGGFGRYGGFGYGGFYDPFWSFGPQVYSTTLFNSYVAVRINRVADNQSVFEGRAETVSRTNDLTRLVPPLVEALFTNFPGNSGETVRVKLPDRPAPARLSRAPA